MTVNMVPSRLSVDSFFATLLTEDPRTNLVQQVVDQTSSFVKARTFLEEYMHLLRQLMPFASQEQRDQILFEQVSAAMKASSNKETKLGWVTMLESFEQHESVVNGPFVLPSHQMLNRILLYYMGQRTEYHIARYHATEEIPALIRAYAVWLLMNANPGIKEDEANRYISRLHEQFVEKMGN